MPLAIKLGALVRFGLVTADLARIVAFYRDTLGFTMLHGPVPVDPAEMVRLGLTGGGWRAGFTLGDQVLSIDQYEHAGRPYPAGSDAASPWFQHFAIVVDDMAAAYARVRNAVPISHGGPQRLPPASGAVEAYKFRDPDGHPLELLQFSPGTVPVPWAARRTAAGAIGLGIDHSAISVANADASVAFYASLGLSPGARAVNTGPAQERLDGLATVTVDVVPMMPRRAPPHLELLGYRSLGGGAGWPANDIVASRLVWRSDQNRLLRDPDGHLHQLDRDRT